MERYIVGNTKSGHVFGVYEGVSEEDAIINMLLDAGDDISKFDFENTKLSASTIEESERFFKEAGVLEEDENLFDQNGYCDILKIHSLDY